MRPGMRVLVKTKFAHFKSPGLRNPDIVAAVCKLLLDGGCKVDVADSPRIWPGKIRCPRDGLDENWPRWDLKSCP